MMLSFRQRWNNLRASFWFIPTLMVAASVGLAIGLIQADTVVSAKWLAKWPRLFGATPEGARELLGTIAGSMMSVMGVTFSMTLVALTLASSQYTSRSLRNFMRSRVMQSTLGVFAGIFTYCLIVLHSVRSGEGELVFVPSLAVFFAFLLALGGIGILIYFIHHIALSIQASSIIASVAEETIATIERLFPRERAEGVPGGDDPVRDVPRLEERTWRGVLAGVDGYIQAVDIKALIRVAQERQTMVRVEHGIGEFVVKDTVLVWLAQEGEPDKETAEALNGCYSIDRHRTVDQDPAFGIRQIVDIALKALSPGVNDTSTGVICVDYLAAILARLAARDFPGLHHYEGDELRVIAMERTFEGLVKEAFDQIRRDAAGNIAIMARVLEALETISSQTDQPERRQALREQVQRITELADRTIDSTHDRAELEVRLNHARDALRSASA